jgi:hypothetical protein
VARFCRDTVKKSALFLPYRSCLFIRSEATSIVFVFCSQNFLLPFSAQKSRVKSLSRLTHLQSTTSALNFSYVQTAILDIDQKLLALWMRWRGTLRANSFGKTNLTHNPFVMTILAAMIFGKPLKDKGICFST